MLTGDSIAFNPFNHIDPIASIGIKTVDPEPTTTTIGGAPTVVPDDGDDDFFDTRLIECLQCREVYEKVGAAKYVRDGDDDFLRKPCVVCGTRDHCIEWGGRSSSSKKTRARRTQKTFIFTEGLVVRVGGARGREG